MQTLIATLQQAVREQDGTQLANIVSPRGLYMAQYGDTSVYLMPEEVHNFFENTELYTWSNTFTGEGSVTESLAGEVTVKLQQDLLSPEIQIACNNNQDTLSDQSSLYAIEIPGYKAVNFYSVLRPGKPGFELDWGAWGLVIEYWGDEPTLLSLGYYVWFP